jgi:hypothetical protein
MLRRTQFYNFHPIPTVRNNVPPRELEPLVTTCARAILTRATLSSSSGVVGVKHILRAYVQRVDNSVSYTLVVTGRLTEAEIKAHMPSRRRKSRDEWVEVFGVKCDLETAALLNTAHLRACEVYPPKARLGSGFLFETMLLERIPSVITLLKAVWIDERKLLNLVAQPKPKEKRD